MVVAAGTGTRFGAPKQYEVLGDRRVLDWAVAAARAVAEGVVLVVAPDRAGEAEPGVDAVVAGAQTRSGSVRVTSNVQTSVGRMLFASVDPNGREVAAAE